MTTKMANQSYDSWEREVTDCIINRLEIANSDAQAILEAWCFTLAQCWGRAESAEYTADLLVIKQFNS